MSIMSKSPKKTVTVSGRIAADLKDRLLQKHPNPGEMNKLIQTLLQRYDAGKIIGVKIEITQQTQP